jgi:hypothetical protein
MLLTNNAECFINIVVNLAPNEKHGHDKPEVLKSSKVISKSSQQTISSDFTLGPPSEVIQYYV